MRSTPQGYPATHRMTPSAFGRSQTMDQALHLRREQGADAGAMTVEHRHDQRLTAQIRDLHGLVVSSLQCDGQLVQRIARDNIHCPHIVVLVVTLSLLR